MKEKTNDKKKSFFSKKKNSSGEVDTYFLLLLVFSLLLSVTASYLTKKLFLFVAGMLLGLAFYVITSPEVKEERIEKKKRKEKEFYVSFYENYYLYSVLLDSYREGLKKAYDLLPISHLKDDLTDHFENKSQGLPLRYTGTRREARLIDFLNREEKSEEEVTPEEKRELRLRIDAYEEELLPPPKEKDFSFLSPFVFLLGFALLLLINVLLPLFG